MVAPTFEQLSEFHEQVKSGRVTRENFQAYLRNPNSVFGSNFSIDRSRPFNPAKFIGKGWSIVGQDERSLAITELDSSKIRLVTMLNDDETRVQGEERLRRLKVAGHIRLDAKIFQTFWENKNRIPEDWKKKSLIAFEGTELRGPCGNRCVLFLYWGGGRWYWRCHLLVRDWGSAGPSAVLAE